MGAWKLLPLPLRRRAQRIRQETFARSYFQKNKSVTGTDASEIEDDNKASSSVAERKYGIAPSIDRAFHVDGTLWQIGLRNTRRDTAGVTLIIEQVFLLPTGLKRSTRLILVALKLLADFILSCSVWSYWYLLLRSRWIMPCASMWCT